ncbi:MAG: UDP-3-O-(3-hydroxymyristoyl)glucosamine N-acyltransferase [Bacteroidetes bacterium]|nr:MAG: UDP-3-O-(3-hydroxymyristoyl)glucosamine N-acyltransferase [Bacteroidota bacterium]
MKFSLSQIAEILQAKIEGDPHIEIHDLSQIDAGKAGSITFLANPKYTPYIYSTEASAVIVGEDFVPQQPVKAALLRVKDPYTAFSQLLLKVNELLHPPKKGIEQPAYIDETATIGQDVYIGAFAYIGPGAVIEDGAQIYPHSYVGAYSRVGAGSVLYAGVKVYEHCVIGKACILHAGACIGSDGFGFAPQPDGSFLKIPQIGRVVLEDQVEVGANATIDRATVGTTLLRRGTKLDNLVQIAHNVEVGEHTAIAAQAGIAGSTHIGKHCQIGGQAGLVGHLRIADRTKIDAQSGVARSIREPGHAFRGSPAQPYHRQLRSEIVFRKLDELQKKVHELEKVLADNGESA